MKRKTERSWILYDVANSAYSMAIMTALFPVYFNMISNGKAMNLGYFNSIASIFVALVSPILGTIADYKDKKKRFFLFFFLLGVSFTMLLGVLPDSSYLLLAIVYVVTLIGFQGSNIFYDAFLVDVTENERMDKVSTKGYAYGYIFSIIPFGISLAVIYMMGMSNTLGYKIGFIITALWWGLFTIPMLRHVKQIHYIESEEGVVRKSFSRLITTFKQVKKYPKAFTFLIAYFLYIDGVSTIIKMVVPYAESVLSGTLNTMLLLGYLLVIQIMAFPFAILYGHLSTKYGTLRLIKVGILTYLIATVFAFFMSSIIHVFILGLLIASAQGGIQALSRSYYAKIIPKKSSNEFFGIYNVFGKFAAILGPFIMSLINSLTGSARFSILGLIPLFLIGFIFILRVEKIG